MLFSILSMIFFVFMCFFPFDLSFHQCFFCLFFVFTCIFAVFKLLFLIEKENRDLGSESGLVVPIEDILL